MKTYSRVYARIDLDAIAYNMEQMKQRIDGHTQIMAVIKTDAYGHGAVQVAQIYGDLQLQRWTRRLCCE